MSLTDYDLLSKPLHTLQVEELQEVRHIADSMFARLTRPFRQSRVEWEFDFDATLRDAAQNGGNLLPTYTRQVKTHPKSSLVIAMSLSGIDRCYAVGLIPLLSELKKFLNFKLFIYTDTLVQAQFTEDGYLANDCDLAWNNVIAPVVFAQLADMDFDRQETKLLLIDSLGGGDSEWYSGWCVDISHKARIAQREFTGNCSWTDARGWLNGRYDKFAEMPDEYLPYQWQEKVDRNISKRWVNTPALREYLIRYIFNPDFGNVKHGCYDVMKQTKSWVNVTNVFAGVKEKFKSVHLLTPIYTQTTQHMFKTHFRQYGLVDFHHQADTLEGFGKMLINIVYGRETNRLTTSQIRFGKYDGKGMGGDEEDGFTEDEVSGHSELTKTFKDCFIDCPDVEHPLPSPTTHTFVKMNLRRTDYHEEQIPYDEIDLDLYWRWGSILNKFPDWKIDASWSYYSKLAEANKVLDFIRGKFFAPAISEYDVYIKDRIYEPDHNKSDIPEPEYKQFHTRALQKHAEDLLRLFSKVYVPYFIKLPLKSVVWCTLGKFRHDKLAISASPADSDDQKRATVFHEMGHWAEHVCPAIGVFTNNLLRQLTGEVNLQKLVPVGAGEYAAPKKDDKWIDDYAGKWYRRHHRELPNPTEILTVHLSYFHSPKVLMELLAHDPKMVKMVAFILMGGPVALLEALKDAKTQKALEGIKQRDRRANAIKERKGRPRGGNNRKEEIPNVFDDTPREERKSFGI